MNMKKMRGFVDPYTLGFILAAVIATTGAATEKQQESKAQSQQASYVQQDTVPRLQATHPKSNDSFTGQ